MIKKVLLGLGVIIFVGTAVWSSYDREAKFCSATPEQIIKASQKSPCVSSELSAMSDRGVIIRVTSIEQSVARCSVLTAQKEALGTVKSKND
ncbi:Hypothetical protein (plasmid) [Pseudomonas putida]|nr:Hypothetical protein [Pseudomonas putida]